MSTVKISELPVIPYLNHDTTQTLLPAVDLETGVTGKITTKVLADTLYANNVLNVGNNDIIFPGVVAQFVGEDDAYLQVNIQNINANGSTDLVLTADDGTDETYFIDIGIQGSDAPLGALQPHDGYLIVQGDDANNTGNLVIGTSSAAEGLQLKFVAGGYEEDNVYAVFETSQAYFLNNVVVDGTITGATITAMDSYATSGHNTANAGFLTANAVGSFANGAFSRANGSASFANGAFSAANSVAESVSSINLTLLSTQNYANGGFTQANSASSFANGAFTQANSASSYANGAFTKANNALANTTGTFGGDLTIAGNTYANSVNTANLVVVGTTSISGTASLAGSLNVTGAVTMNATVVLSNTTFSNTEAALTISASNTVVTPANDGYMIHISGKNGVASRVVTDSYGTGAYALYAGRAARGTVTSPTALQTGDVISRFSSSGYGTTKYQALGTGRIDFVAAENYTDANTGSRIQFWNCPIGSNTLTNIATFNGESAIFTGVVNPTKGFIYNARVTSGNQTTITINYATDSIIKANCVDNLTISHTNFTSGKVIEVWLVNTDTQNHTITHGCTAMNSTNKATTATITSSSSMLLKFFSIDGDLANTFVSING